MIDEPMAIGSSEAAKGKLLLASETGAFVSVFRRYFAAAGYSVLVASDPIEVYRAIRGDDVALLVLDSALAGADLQGTWRPVLSTVETYEVPVLAAYPRDCLDASQENPPEWARDHFTYPMNPEKILQKIEAATAGVACPGGPATAAPVGPADGPATPPSHSLKRRTWGERAVSRILDEQPTLRFLELGQSVFDQISDAIFVFARTGQIMMANDAACRMLGFERHEILGRSAGMVFSQIEPPPPEMGRPDLRSTMAR
ncbi:MAG: PAS domain-containing protein, partial [Planctomycetota bacterium]